MRSFKQRVLRRFLSSARVVCCIAAIAFTAQTQAALIPATNVVDMVHDAGRGVLYITQGTNVLRYSLASNVFLSPIPLSGTLKGIDLSLDGNWLAVADHTYTATNVWIHLVDLRTLASRKQEFGIGSSEGGTHAVAWEYNGAVLISSKSQISGVPAPLRSYDPGGSKATGFDNIPESSMLTASADRRTIAIGECNSSLGLRKFDVTSQMIVKSAYTGQNGFEVGVSRDGGQIALAGYNRVQVYSSNLVALTNITSSAGKPVGVVYHPMKDALLISYSNTNKVLELSTRNFEELGGFTLSTNLPSANAAAYSPGRLKVSSDGALIFVTTTAGIEWFTNNVAIPEYRRVEIDGSPLPLGFPTSLQYGTNEVLLNTLLTNTVPAVVEHLGVRYYASFALLNGATPLINAPDQVSFLVTNHTRLTWNWKPVAYLLNASGEGGGTVSTNGGWFPSNEVVTITATPSSGSRFLRWLGDVPPPDASTPALSLTMDRARNLVASFAPADGSPSLSGPWSTFGNGPAHSGYFSGITGGVLFSNRWTWTTSFGTPVEQVAVSQGRTYVTGTGSSPFFVALEESSGKPLWHHLFSPVLSMSPPTVENDAVYFQHCYGSADSRLWCFNTADGTTNWAAPTSAGSGPYMAPVAAEGKVWSPGDSSIYAFEATNGSQLFKAPMEYASSWTPAYTDGKLYTFIKGKFCEHNASTGATNWTLNLWQDGGNAPSLTPVIANGRAFLTAGGILTAIDLSLRNVAWKVPAYFSAYPAVANGVVYAIMDNSVSAYTVTGLYVRTYTADANLAGQPILTRDTLIVASDSKTYIFDLLTGALKQTLPIGGKLSLADGVLYVANSSGELRAFSANPDITLAIDAQPFQIGFAQPNNYGSYWFSSPRTLSNSVPLITETNGIRYQCSGWIGTGSVPLTGSTNRLAFELSTNSTLTWKWDPVGFQLTVEPAGRGFTSITNQFFPTGETASITATPQPGFRFLKWAGDVPDAAVLQNPLLLTMSQKRKVLAVFGSTNQNGLAGDWPTFGNGPAHTGYFPGRLGAASLNLRWRTSLLTPLQQVAVGNHRVYVTPRTFSAPGSLTGILEYSGQTDWHYEFPSAYSINPPTYDSGSVYLQRCNSTSDTHVWSFDAASGAMRWRTPYTAQLNSYMAPTVADGGIWISGEYGGLVGFDLTNGTKRFSFYMPQGEGWAPSYYKGIVYTHVRDFRAHDPATGSVLWSTNTSALPGSSASSTLAIADDRAWFVLDSNLLCVDLNTRAIAVRIDGGFTSVPALANGIIYAIRGSTVVALNSAGTLFAVYDTSGFNTLQGQPIVTDDALIVPADTATFVFNLSSAALLRILPAGGQISLADGVLYIASATGDLHAYATGSDRRLEVKSNGATYGKPELFAYGTNWIQTGTLISPSVPSPAPGPDGTRYVVTGWQGTGSVPATGTSNALSFKIDADSTLTWNWKSQHYLSTAVSGSGSMSPQPGWYDAGSTLTISATPSNYFHFARWQGGFTGTQPSVPLQWNAPATITAVFEPDLVTNNTPTWWLAQYGLPLTDAAALMDNDADGLPNWREFQFNSNPFLHDTDADGYYDGLEVAWGSDPTLKTIVPLVPFIVKGSPSTLGAPSPAGYGTNWVPLYSRVTNTVAAVVPGTNGQRFACIGWTGAGDVPLTGTTNSVEFIAQTNATLTWLWQTQYQLAITTISNGIVQPSTGWFPTGTDVTLTATPAPWFFFDKWTGAIQSTSNPVVLTLTSPKSVVATFIPELVTNNVPKWWLDAFGLPISDAGALADNDGDSLQNWQEFQAGSNPYLKDTDADGYEDPVEVAYGSSPSNPNAVPLVSLSITASPSLEGTPFPQNYGTNRIPLFQTITNTVPQIAPATKMVRFLNHGWSGTGSVPAQGTSNQVSFLLSTNSTLTWKWMPQYNLTIGTNLYFPRVQSPAATLLPADLRTYDAFGWSVAIDGDIAVIGAPFHQVTTYALGIAYVYRWDKGRWKYEASLDPTEIMDSSLYFGCTVAVRGNRVAVGSLVAPLGSFTSECVAYTYTNSSGKWVRETGRRNSTKPASAWYGWQIALGDDFLVIGTPSDSSSASSSGSVSLFRYSSSQWSSTPTRIYGDFYKPYQYFGWSVAVSGTNLIVGAPGDAFGRTNSGAAYVYRIAPQSQTREAKLAPADPTPNAQFGASVAAAPGIFVVGAPSESTADVPSGAAYVFARGDTSWTNGTRLLPPSNQAYANFGYSVAATTNAVLVGAPRATGSSPASGAAYLFEWSGTQWSVQNDLHPEPGSAEDLFGFAVAASAQTSIVGAPDSDLKVLDAGAALIFEPRGSGSGAPTWWDNATIAATPIVPESTTFSNAVYHFVHWTLDGSPQADPQGTSLNPLTGVLMDRPHAAMAVYVPEAQDSDSDQLPDWWELRYLNTLATTGADDSDADGFSNLNEWLAGTQPALPTSLLKVSAAIANNRLVLSWPSVTARTYRLLSAPSLTGVYLPIETNIVATPPINQREIEPGTGPVFFRIQLE